MERTMESSDLLKCNADDLGGYILLPGDPGRVSVISELLEGAREVSHRQSFLIHTGTLEGEKVSVVSTGMGCPAARLVTEELCLLGAHTFIRVGTAGMMQTSTQPRDLVITWAAVRDEMTTLPYLPLNYPAVADLDVTLSLAKSAKELGESFHVGITQTKDSFYTVHNPERMPVGETFKTHYEGLIKGGVLCNEMEASAIFIISKLYHRRAGGIMFLGSSSQGMKRFLQVAVNAIRILIHEQRN
jgi:uridine phosphorylase